MRPKTALINLALIQTGLFNSSYIIASIARGAIADLHILYYEHTHI